MSDKISGKFHPIPSTIANQRWISIHDIIIYMETKFRPNRRIFVFGHFIPWLPWQRPPFWICSTPQMLPHTTVDIPTKWIIIWLPNHGYQFPTSKSTWKPNFAQIGGFLYFGRHFGFKMAAIANQRWISIRNIIIYLETKFRPNRRIFVFGGHFVPGYHGNDHHFEFVQPPKAAIHYDGYSYKFSWSLMKGIPKMFESPFCVSMATAAKFVQPIPIFLAYLVPLDVDDVPIKFHKFLFGE